MHRIRIVIAALLIVAPLALASSATPAAALTTCHVYIQGSYTSTICDHIGGYQLQYAQHGCRGQGGTIVTQRGNTVGAGQYSVAGACLAVNTINRKSVGTNNA